MKRITFAVAAALALSASAAYAEGVQETWDKKCANCHGKDGKGETKMGAKLKVEDLTKADVQSKFTDEQATKDITEGIKEKKMPAFKGKLSDAEIADLVKYTRSLKK